MVLVALSGCKSGKKDVQKPNILFIMSDDHTTQAVGAYGSRLARLNPTPTIDALAHEGMLFENAICTNSIFQYWMHMAHHDNPGHFALRSKRYKLIFFYGRRANAKAGRAAMVTGRQIRYLYPLGSLFCAGILARRRLLRMVLARSGQYQTPRT
jgi:hypothetical protein